MDTRSKVSSCEVYQFLTDDLKDAYVRTIRPFAPCQTASCVRRQIWNRANHGELRTWEKGKY